VEWAACIGRGSGMRSNSVLTCVIFMLTFSPLKILASLRLHQIPAFFLYQNPFNPERMVVLLLRIETLSAPRPLWMESRS